MCISASCFFIDYLLIIGNDTMKTMIYPGLQDPFERFFSFDKTEFFSHFLSKFMGYLIVVGSSIMKVPQILQIVRNRSVVGLNLSSLYFECAENIPIVIYNMIHVGGIVYLVIIALSFFYIWRISTYYVSGDFNHSSFSYV